MKKLLLTLFLTVMVSAVAQAQQISVVSSNGATTLYSTLQEAIEGASNGSVIYLPGGGFPISDEVKITKKLTIIGIGHYTKNENVDGVTTILGNLFFNEESGGSAVMACYITGNVNIGVDDILIRYCNLNSVQVNNQTCKGTEINQNYIRSSSNFNQTPAKITNNVMWSVGYVTGGNISYNFFNGWFNAYYGGATYEINSSFVSNNCFNQGDLTNYSNTITSGNMGTSDHVGDNCIYLGENVNWNDVYVNYNNGAISPKSDFHFKDDYKQYENKVGIYAGDTPFNDNQIAPVPHIVAKHVDEHTDTTGKLNIKIRVKAGQ